MTAPDASALPASAEDSELRAAFERGVEFGRAELASRLAALEKVAAAAETIMSKHRHGYWSTLDFDALEAALAESAVGLPTASESPPASHPPDCDCDCHFDPDMDPSVCDRCTGKSERERAESPPASQEVTE